MNEQTNVESQGASANAPGTLPVPASATRTSIPQPEPSSADPSTAGQPSPTPGGRGSASADSRLRFTEESHQYIRDHIRLADQKAAFFFTAATALLAFLYQNRVSNFWLHRPVMTWNILDVAAFLAMLCLAGAALLALYVLMPRLPGPRRGFIFWEAIAEYQTARQYSDELLVLSEATLAQEKAEHCHTLAGVCSEKFKVLRLAFYVLGVGLVCSIVVLLFLLPGGGPTP